MAWQKSKNNIARLRSRLVVISLPFARQVTELSFSVDMDYTKFGKVQLKIIVLGNDHADAITTASNIIRNQWQYVKHHKEELDNDRVSYNKSLADQLAKSIQKAVAENANSSSNNNPNNENATNVPVTVSGIYS